MRIINLYKYVLGLGLFFFITACEDATDIEQPGRLSAENAFQSVGDLELGLLAVYNEFDYTPQIQFNSVFTDQVKIGIESGGQGIGNGEYGFRLNAASAISSALWQNFYDALNASSRVIEAASLIEIGEDEQDRFNDVLGQTLALRAWAHFELLTYFSADIQDDNSLGVIIVNFVPELGVNLPRATTGEVFTVIEADLTQAEGLILDQSNATFVSRDFVTALRARIALYRGNYAEADALAASLLNDYALSDRDDYEAMFADDSNGEVIFKLERALNGPYDGQGATGSAFAGGWAGANFAFGNATRSGTPYFELSNDLFLELDPNDVRYDVLINETAELENNILPINKYAGSEGRFLMNDLKVFRASEMLFIRAEAAADRGDFTTVAGLLDQLQEARFGETLADPVIPSEQAAFNAILEARRIELAYEGFRWLDLRRIGARAGVTAIERQPQDCAINGACSLPLSDVRMDYLAIPIIELDANPLVAAQQNPGY